MKRMIFISIISLLILTGCGSKASVSSMEPMQERIDIEEAVTAK